MRAKKKVIPKELVTVKTKGIRPARFSKKIDENRKNKEVKYCCFLMYKFSLTIDLTSVYTLEIT